MQAPDWLQDIALVTFDCFGTLIDWRVGLSKVGIESDADFQAFEKACLELQGRDRHVPYTMVLKEAIRSMRPQLRPAIIGLFADDFGRLGAFGDAPGGLASLKQMVQVGVLSNCDANHQLDVISTLRVAWDVCVTSQEIRAYKPSDRAWDAILRMGVARTAAPRDAWLHVSAFHAYDLGPARDRGLKTCLLRRPGGDQTAPADFEVDGLDELVSLVAQAKQGPVLLEVQSTCADGATRDELATWLIDSQMVRIRGGVPGVRDARLVEEEDGTLVEQYTFGGRREYDNYAEAFAAEHRASVRDRFGDRVQRSQRLARVRGRA